MKLSEDYVFGGRRLKIDFWRSKEDIEAEEAARLERFAADLEKA